MDNDRLAAAVDDLTDHSLELADFSSRLVTAQAALDVLASITAQFVSEVVMSISAQANALPSVTASLLS